MWERRRKPSFEVNDLTVPPASVSSASSVSSPLSPGTDGFAHAPNGCHDHGPGHWKKMAQKEYMYKKIFNTRLHSIKPLAPTPRMILTCICVSPPLWSPSLVVSASPSLSAPWSGQRTGYLSSPYWAICGPDSLSSGEKCVKQYKRRKVREEYPEVKIKPGLQIGRTSAVPVCNRGCISYYRVNVCLLVPCFWFWRWWQALLWTCP